MVQVLKIRKKAWIALRLHLDNICNLLAGTWRQETRHQSTPPPHSPSKKKRERRGKTDSEICLITYLAKKKTHSFSITADAAPSRSRIFKGLLANASAVTDDKENVFAYAATDEKENDHYWSRAHLPGAEISKAPRSRLLRQTTRTRTEVRTSIDESYWPFKLAI
jgi:hypothetical protein